MKKIFNLIKENLLVIFEAIIAFLIAIFNFINSQNREYLTIISWVLFVLLIFDICLKTYNKIKEKQKERDLKRKQEKNERKRDVKIQKIMEDAEEQKKFNLEYKEKKEKSIRVINKFFAKSLLNEEDILSLAKSSTYYILFVYCWPFPKIKKYNFKTKRQYPLFLEEIGFSRMGTISTLFVIKKERLKNKKYHNIVEFKKFLSENFERIRKEEFALYLDETKKQNQELYKKYYSNGYDKILKINFLLLENIIHSGNIGFVGGEYIGLSGKRQNEDISKQILEGIELSEIDLKENVKLRIKDYFKKQDFDLLLEGIDQNLIDKISNARNELKNELNIQNVLEISGKSELDIQKALVKIGIPDPKDIAPKMTKIAKEYNEALDDLNIEL